MRLGMFEAHALATSTEEFSGSNVRTLRPTSRGKIIGNSSSVRAVLDTIDRVARSSCTVLVTGESGTGKELVVAALHDASDRRNAPLITINCGAIPNELVESELFGHVRGAFTGAQTARRGHVASAEGGTLFLDEVGELPLSVQVKLLRVLQQREYTPIGESKAVKCDVRVVAATHRDLEAEVRAGRFREDLYYRLNVIHIGLPALRERRGDIRLLAQHFFKVSSERSGRTDLHGLSPTCLMAVEQHNWPGNIRALENAIERGVLLARGPFVEAEDVIKASAVRPLSAIPVRTTRSMSAVNVPPTPSLIEQTGVYPKTNIPPVGLMSMPAPPPASVAVAPAIPSSVAPAYIRRASDPSFPRALPEAGVDLSSAVESYQNNLIRQALTRTGGNKNRAAQLLGLNRTTLVEIIRRRGITT